MCRDNKRQTLCTGESNPVIISTAVLTRCKFSFTPFVLMKNTGYSRTFHAQYSNRNGENSRSVRVVANSMDTCSKNAPM